MQTCPDARLEVAIKGQLKKAQLLKITWNLRVQEKKNSDTIYNDILRTIDT
jgi:hypothetical protein